MGSSLPYYTLVILVLSCTYRYVSCLNLNGKSGLRKTSPQDLLSRRAAIVVSSSLVTSTQISKDANAKQVPGGGMMFEIRDRYPALVYVPPTTNSTNDKGSSQSKKLPVLIVLHGAGKNELDVWNLANIQGEHSGLPPSLIASGQAPSELLNNFIVVAPYSFGKTSFYDEPRSKILEFISVITGMTAPDPTSDLGENDFVSKIDLNRLFLFGFSDGATLGIELMTTRKFAAGVIAAYGFTGTLPTLALERLKDLPLWIFHSADDVIFPVRCSDNLVRSLRQVNKNNDIIRYSRFDKDQEGFTGRLRGHSTGITASKNPETYKWLLNVGQAQI
jgi:predicted peptidase